MKLCKNAHAGIVAWFCYHYAGAPVKGKEGVNERGYCEACAKLDETVETLPNFMTDEAND